MNEKHIYKVYYHATMVGYYYDQDQAEEHADRLCGEWDEIDISEQTYENGITITCYFIV